jgi:cysteine desulfurase
MKYYFDHAATTPLDPIVLESMKPFLETEYANPSSIYTPARTTRLALEQARKSVADILGSKPTEIIFTSGGTEGNNLAIQGVLRAFPQASWVTTAIEHDAVLGQVLPLSKLGHEGMVVKVKPNGIVDPNSVIDVITDETVLVSVMLANNEIGTIQPVSEIAKQLSKIRLDRKKRNIDLPIYLHTDAVQAANYLDLHVERLGVDLLTLSGSKIYGPRGTGIMYIRHTTILEPLFYGGGQERGRRSGTENVAGVIGFSKALSLAQTERSSEAQRVSKLRDELLKKIIAVIPDTIINGDSKRRLPNNINLTIPGSEGEGMVLYLDNAGVLVSTGSACSSGSLDPSHVLLALGRSNVEADQSLRITLGRDTTTDMCDLLAKELPQVVKRLRELQAL